MQLLWKFLSTRSGKSVILRIDNQMYAFNIFEGFQRYCIQKQVPMSSLTTVFLSNELNIPPFCGVYFTLNESNKTDLNVVYPENLDLKIIFNLKSFSGFPLSFRKDYQDENISVEIVNNNYQSDYIITFRKINGKFLPNLVPPQIPKKLYKKLANKEVVEFENNIYNGSDYCDNDVKIQNTAIIFRENLDDSELKYFVDKSEMIICTNYRNILSVCRYIKHNKIEKNIKLYVINDNNCIEYTDLYDIQRERNLSNESCLLPVKSSFAIDFNYIEEIKESALILESGDKLDFNRETGLSIIRDKKEPESHCYNSPLIPSLLFLGTGCAIPSKYRNVSSILYETENSAILLDCGEDTAGQILRVYGDYSCLKKLKIIYISHSHADHILGIPRILYLISHQITILAPRTCIEFIKSRYRGISHKYVETSYAKELEDLFYKEYPEMTMFQNSLINDSFFKLNLERFFINLTVENFHIKISGCIHSKDSTSVLIRDQIENRSIVYTGDTIPSALCAYMSHNADVLMHEASFTEEDIQRAIETCHSTQEQATELFKKVGAKKLLLTHFSNRRSINDLTSDCMMDFYRFDFTKEL